MHTGSETFYPSERKKCICYSATKQPFFIVLLICNPYVFKIIHMRATKQLFPVVLVLVRCCTMQFEHLRPWIKIHKCDNLNENYRAILSCSAVYVEQSDSHFLVSEKIVKNDQ